MIYTAIDTFYLSDEQLKNSPSRKDGIDEETETTLRIYGCDLIQESGILLKLPQAVMATGQVLFHRFYCKKSFARFDVKRVASSCVWLASKLEESPRKARQVLIVFHRMECRRENLPIEHLDKKYSELKMDLSRTERHLLKEMGFICHVEHPHKFISNYLATLETPPELRQEAWNLANDSLRTTLCVRFKSEVVACGVVYAAARRFQVPLPEDPPWWKAFDAEKSAIDEVCRVLAHLYSRPKAKYIPVCKDAVLFTSSNKSWDSQSQAVLKEGARNTPVSNNDTITPKMTSSAPTNAESKDSLIKQALDKLLESKRVDDDDSKIVLTEGDGREDTAATRSKAEHKTEASGERSSKDRERDRRDMEREKQKSRDRERRRDSDRERDRDETTTTERDRDSKAKERIHRSKDKAKDSGGHSDKSSRHHSSRDRDREYHASYSSREKDRHRHHSYA
ncbi:hypothetical protein Nepgr_030381 [Nepenthes gracilis]|uniref:Cyclin-L1-1 n=1 Tax=Nepenthes gracilis TaxID=150966 RepID=A0AAD3TGD9_NEPGR|nr:hypothetical protein Nepgr_030381 [Nepenthes gracilis]